MDKALVSGTEDYGFKPVLPGVNKTADAMLIVNRIKSSIKKKIFFTFQMKFKIF